MVAACGLAGCALVDATGQPELRDIFVDLDDGAILGGAQETEMSPVVSAEIARVELFLGDEYLGADLLAPFAVRWNTTGHAEGRHLLRARVIAADGTIVPGAIRVVIDNTRPSVRPLPARLSPGDEIEIEAGDAHRLDKVELRLPGRTARVEGPPYLFTWDVPCGIAEVTITAEDRAGWLGRWTGLVETSLAGDQDCDGYPSPEEHRGGSDCDGQDPLIHPGAIDDGPEGDVNCDGTTTTAASWSAPKLRRPAAGTPSTASSATTPISTSSRFPASSSAA